jgi:hypothetical protein
VQKRLRDPIKARTAATWSSYLKYLNATIGDVQLVDINNRTMKTQLIAVMASEKTNAGGRRFSPKSIENYLAIVKMVVASVLNDKDEEAQRRE